MLSPIQMPMALSATLVLALAIGCQGPRTRGTEQTTADPKGDSMHNPDVTPAEAKKMIETKGFVYVDVRTVAEYEAGHPSAAWNVPVAVPNAAGWMEENPDFVPVIESHFPKDANLIVGCRSGGRSAAAAEILRDAGYPHVYNMMGGYAGGQSATGQEVRGWLEHGFPVDHDAGGPRAYSQLRQKTSK